MRLLIDVYHLEHLNDHYLLWGLSVFSLEACDKMIHQVDDVAVTTPDNGRIMLRKYFTETAPIELPRGHTTVAFSEPQIHAVLKIVSDVTVKSSLHAMRSLVLQAVYGGKGQTAGQFRKALIRVDTPARGLSTRSEGELESDGYSTDGYTSGAFATEKDIGAASFSPGAESDAYTSTGGTHTKERGIGRNSGQATVPSPGYSEGDYEPLCTIGLQVKHKQSMFSPPAHERNENCYADQEV